MSGYAGKNRGRIAEPSHSVAIPTGTRSRIFSFNQFCLESGLKIQANLAGDTASRPTGGVCVHRSPAHLKDFFA